MIKLDRITHWPEESALESVLSEKREKGRGLKVGLYMLLLLLLLSLLLCYKEPKVFARLILF